MEILSLHVTVLWLCWFSLFEQIVDFDFKAKIIKVKETKHFTWWLAATWHAHTSYLICMKSGFAPGQNCTESFMHPKEYE